MTERNPRAPIAKVRPTAGPPPAELRLSKVQKARFKPVGDFAVLPEVQRLVTKYKPNRDDSIGRPAERVLNWVLTVDRFLTDHADARSLASAMLKDDLRTPLFQLEGPLRLYTPRFGRDFGKALERVKALEDRLGEVLLRRELAALATERKFPSAVFGGLRKDERKAMTELEKLVARDWTPDPDRRDQVPALDFVIGRVLDADFGSDEKDVKFLRLAMAETIEGIEGTKWNLNDLKAGIHELRRHIRWLPIYFQALGGAVQLSEKQNPIAALKELLDTPAAHSPFIQMAGPEREKNPIVLSKSLLIANSGMIDRLGKIKDAGEHVDYLAHALRDAGLAGKKDAEDMARQYLGAGHEEDDVFSAARRDWQAFRAQGVLKALRRELV